VRVPLLGVLGSLVLAVLFAPAARGGGAPETTLVVANADSPSSLRVANEYVRLRRIPATHVVAIGDVPASGVVPVEVFRERLWKPVRAWLDRHDPDARVDTIAWSTDFPYGVDWAADEREAQPPISPIASLTSMTFFARRVEAKDAKGYLSLTGNGYYRRYDDEEAFGGRPTPSDAERALFDDAEEHVRKGRWEEAEKAFDRLLATYRGDYVAWYDAACAYARRGRGDEAIAALERAAELGWADAAHMREDADLESLRSRPAFRSLADRLEAEAKNRTAWPSRGFTARAAWTGSEAPDPAAASDSKDLYRLSTMLGWSGAFGNTVPEILACLERAASSDGTKPAGTVYLCKNGDVRSTTREPRFEACVRALEALGRRAVVLAQGDPGQTGVLPMKKDDVIGAVVGTSDFSWPTSGSTLLPGSIAEHLTSFGAVFGAAGQTKASEWIRYGAAGTSGAVYEPYAIAAKFPAPHVHVHYAAGCSLAEAFYQSVRGPYQLLVLGDPLARPFAKFATLAPPPLGGETVKGVVEVRTDAHAAADTSIERLELWVDGRFAAEAAAGSPLSWDSTSAEDGAHEVRLLAVEAGRIATRTSSAPVIVTVGNGSEPPPTIAGPHSATLDARVSFEGRAPGAATVELLAGSRVLATSKATGGAWRVTVAAEALGMGALSLQARAVSESGAGRRSAFHELRIDAPPPRKPARHPARTAPGLRFAWKDAQGKSHDETLASLGGVGADPVTKQLEAKVKEKPRSIAVDGEVEIKTAGLYQLDVSASGKLELRVDGKLDLVDPDANPGRARHALLALEPGWHSLSLDLVPEGSWDLSVTLSGDRVSTPLAGALVRREVR
jgi:tetratricopeptide (TPR) repeat protein